MGNQNSRKLKNVDELSMPDNINWSNTIPFIVPLKKGKVIKVYDGDTITVASRIPEFNPNTIYRFSIRIRGIDAPEMKSQNEEEKEMAIKARDALNKMLLNKIVTLDNLSSEKYSRLLADVYCNGISVGDFMLNKRYAVPYDGGTKKSPKSWKKYFESGSFDEEESVDDPPLIFDEKIEKCIQELEPPKDVSLSSIPIEGNADVNSIF